MSLIADYIHHYRGYWSDGGGCRIRIYREDGQAPVVICTQLPENDNTSVTNMAEYLAAEVIEDNSLPTPLSWIEHYPEHEGEVGEYSLVVFSSWEVEETHLGGAGRLRVGRPRWSHLESAEVEKITGAKRRVHSKYEEVADVEQQNLRRGGGRFRTGRIRGGHPGGALGAPHSCPAGLRDWWAAHARR